MVELQSFSGATERNIKNLDVLIELRKKTWFDEGGWFNVTARPPPHGILLEEDPRLNLAARKTAVVRGMRAAGAVLGNSGMTRAEKQWLIRTFAGPGIPACR